MKHVIPYLGASYNIKKVVIKNRQNCCQDRAIGMSLSVWNDKNVAVYNPPGITVISMQYVWYPPNYEVFYDEVINCK